MPKLSTEDRLAILFNVINCFGIEDWKKAYKKMVDLVSNYEPPKLSTKKKKK